MALPVFAITLFVSAFLLFLVQPMIGKMILPRLGGTPNVWNTCMVFFQTALLAGYAYTHTISTRLKVKSQLMVHSIMLFVPLLLIVIGTMVYSGQETAVEKAEKAAAVNSESGDTPEANTTEQSKGVRSWFYLAREWLNPIGGGNPIVQTLFWLTLVVGLPFFVVATSAPLLQRWFAHTGHPAGDDPYFLYAASNIGSFASLLAYPFLLEWILTLNMQSWSWIAGYVILAAMILGCAVMVFQAPPLAKMPAKKEKPKEEAEAKPGEEETKQEEVTEEPEAETGMKAGPPPQEKTGGSFKKGSKRKKKKGKKGGPAVREKTTTKPVEKRSTRTTSPFFSRPDADRLREVTPLRRLRWVALAAIPSSLMLGATTYITTDLSPIPLLWLIPLMLYLLSFVLVFSKWPTEWVKEPHKVMVIAQPFAIALLVISMAIPGFIEGFAGGYTFILITFVHILAFFLTTMVCHGELAKDRPSTEYLTEFYLLMSVGGMLGGMFNALVAPVLFIWGPLEYGLAIFVACVLRPRITDSGWAEDIFNNFFGQSGTRRDRGASMAMEGEGLSYIMDVALPFLLLIWLAVMTFALGDTITNTFGSAYVTYMLAYGIPCIIAIFFLGRPLRFGLAIGALLLIVALYGMERETIVHRDRSYFGIIKVKLADIGGGSGQQYTTLIHGRINHGMNFKKPADRDQWGWGKNSNGNPRTDFSRVSSTYYHRHGPAGLVMCHPKFMFYEDHKKFNTYPSDVRMPASLIGMAAMPLSLPTEQLVHLWSERPFATIGLGTGTMASYTHPYQHMHYYEIDSRIVRLSTPPRVKDVEDLAASEDPYERGPRGPEDKFLTPELHYKYISETRSRFQTYFTYLADAKMRGGEVWVFMGDARLRMAQPYDESREYLDSDEFKKQWNNAYSIRVIDGARCGGPDNFYHMMVVDAFSSDAIPIHLITKEAIAMYMKKLTKDGVLCVHTSNRYVDLVPVVADVAASLGLKARRGHDQAPKLFEGNEYIRTNLPEWIDDHGHFTSEWVMVARTAEALEQVCVDPPDYEDKLRAYNAMNKGNPNKGVRESESYWETPLIENANVWTDDFSNLMGVFREYRRLRGKD